MAFFTKIEDDTEQGLNQTESKKLVLKTTII